MATRTNWLLGGAAVVGVLLLATTAKAALMPSDEGDATDADLDALTRMLLAETSFAARSKDEMAQIVFVAINRARRYGKTLRSVVTPPGSPVWNTGSLYRDRFNAAGSYARYADARAFVQAVLSGAYANSGATSFVHPSGMPTPPCSSNRVATQTVAGTRCVPEWIVGGRVIGTAMFA